jgi:hypothetical protein
VALTGVEEEPGRPAVVTSKTPGQTTVYKVLEKVNRVLFAESPCLIGHQSVQIDAAHAPAKLSLDAGESGRASKWAETSSTTLEVGIRIRADRGRTVYQPTPRNTIWSIGTSSLGMQDIQL